MFGVVDEYLAGVVKEYVFSDLPTPNNLPNFPIAFAVAVIPPSLSLWRLRRKIEWGDAGTESWTLKRARMTRLEIFRGRRTKSLYED